MKVLHVETGMNLYGGAQQVAYLLEGLRRRELENVLVCPKGSAIAQAVSGLCSVHEMPMRGDLDLVFLARFRRLIGKEVETFGWWFASEQCRASRKLCQTS